MIFHQNVAILIQYGFGEDIGFPNVLNHVPEIGIVFKSLLSFIYLFPFIILGARKDLVAAALQVFKYKDVKPGDVYPFSIVNGLVDDIYSRSGGIDSCYICNFVYSSELIDADLAAMIQFINCLGLNNKFIVALRYWF